MCCIFTCCGWMIDLVQRLWTFTMSCCISSAVCTVMLTSSMSGIALGYNYSLAEYIDLKETNVSIYLKRGVFDDEIADDMEWRRAGRMPVAGHIGKDNLKTGELDDGESSSLRSGRRLDDSVFEADNQNKFEGSLMKLTARPPYQDTESPRVTEDLEMGQVASKYPKDSLDQLKAIQSLIDSRRAMITGGTTLSPIATYNPDERNLVIFPNQQNPNLPGNPYRRMMQPGQPYPEPGLARAPPNINPARFAVPDQSIGSVDNWLVPKKPALFDFGAMPDNFVLSPTYPSPITLNYGLARTSVSTPEPLHDGPVMFVTRTYITREPKTTSPTVQESLNKESEPFNEQLLLEDDQQSKHFIKLPKIPKSEEEYEDEIKGLPVRRRRSINVKTLASRENHSSEDRNISTINQSNQSSNEENNVQQMKKLNPHKEHKVEIIEQNVAENKQEKTILGRLITAIEAKKSYLMAETTQKTNNVSAKKIKIQTRRKSFESKIMSSKYVPYTKATRLLDDGKQTKMSHAELLNSISISFNEAGLLRNPASSTFVKLLQSTLS